MYSIVKAVALSDDHPWYTYKNKNDGRYKFQMDLGYDLIRCGLDMDWLAPYDEEHKPTYIQKQNYIPCACKNCFFCIHGKTHGVDHMRKGQKRPTSYKTKPSCVSRREKIGNTHTCGVCYKRERAANPDMGVAALKKRCNNSRLGCPGCNGGKGMYVCKEFWENYEHVQ